MAVTFKAKVVGNIPARRLCVLGGRDDNDTILLKVADRDTSVDFVTTRDLEDGETITISLKDGVNLWTVETAMDVEAGQWMSCREEGKVGSRTGDTIENVGFTLEKAKAGEAVKVVRRESYEQVRGIEINEKLEELETRIEALESGGGE